MGKKLRGFNCQLTWDPWWDGGETFSIKAEAEGMVQEAGGLLELTLILHIPINITTFIITEECWVSNIFLKLTQVGLTWYVMELEPQTGSCAEGQSSGQTQTPPSHLAPNLHWTFSQSSTKLQRPKILQTFWLFSFSLFCTSTAYHNSRDRQHGCPFLPDMRIPWVHTPSHTSLLYRNEKIKNQNAN